VTVPLIKSESLLAQFVGAWLPRRESAALVFVAVSLPLFFMAGASSGTLAACFPAPLASTGSCAGWLSQMKRGFNRQSGRRKISLAGLWRSCSSANTVITLRSFHARYVTSSIRASRAWKCRSRPSSDSIVKPQKSPKRS